MMAIGFCSPIGMVTSSCNPGLYFCLLPLLIYPPRAAFVIRLYRFKDKYIYEDISLGIL